MEEHVFCNVHHYIPYSSTSVAENELNTFEWWSISRQTCITVFATLTLIIIIIAAIRSVLFVSVHMKASMTLHNNMFNSLIKATIYFFNTNSSGNYSYKWL